MTVILSFITLSCLVSCEWSETSGESVLIIAVESLPSEYLPCGHLPLELDGIATLCEESIRFTHAFTPSVMTQSSLASVLTAMYPMEHGVWHNGSQYLSGKFETVSEVALSKGYRTSFFSGGAPIWRKSGLAQGFEVFDDNVKVNYSRYYRPASSITTQFLKWFYREGAEKPFFTLLYFVDTQFEDFPTKNRAGETRELTYQAQVKEIDESLNELIMVLKSKGVWHKTNVFFFGTNGKSRKSRSGELDSYSLYNESVQVPLFIKPARRLKDEAINWKVDRNVSLVDVGATLLDLLGKKIKDSDESRFSVVSLRSIFDRPDASWPDDRFVLTESAWPQWRGVGGSRFGLRQRHFSLIYDTHEKLFNTLIDRFEVNPIRRSDPTWKEVFEPMQEYLEKNGIFRWDGLPLSLGDKLNLMKRIWHPQRSKKQSVQAELARLSRQRKWDSQMGDWRARLALETKNWNLLEKLGEEHKELLWSIVARANRGEPVPDLRDQCAYYFAPRRSEPVNYKDCDDEIFIALLKWENESDSTRKAAKFEEFFRMYRTLLLDRELEILNYRNDLRWDVAMGRYDAPVVSELYLALESSKPILQKISLRLKKSKQQLKIR